MILQAPETPLANSPLTRSLLLLLYVIDGDSPVPPVPPLCPDVPPRKVGREISLERITPAVRCHRGDQARKVFATKENDSVNSLRFLTRQKYVNKLRSGTKLKLKFRQVTPLPPSPHPPQTARSMICLHERMRTGHFSSFWISASSPLSCLSICSLRLSLPNVSRFTMCA